jgi:hypothetical protein
MNHQFHFERDVSVESHCFHSARFLMDHRRLFRDFIEHDPFGSAFYRRSPDVSWSGPWTKLGTFNILLSAASQVAEILERQNRNFGSSQKTLENIAAFKSGAASRLSPGTGWPFRWPSRSFALQGP